MMTSQDEATAVHAVPAQWLECGFRLLILRELRTENEPPAFAWIEQHLLRTPQRLTRHGLFFGMAFRPEIMAWLSEHLAAHRFVKAPANRLAIRSGRTRAGTANLAYGRATSTPSSGLSTSPFKIRRHGPRFDSAGMAG